MYLVRSMGRRQNNVLKPDNGGNNMVMPRVCTRPRQILSEKPQFFTRRRELLTVVVHRH